MSSKQHLSKTLLCLLVGLLLPTAIAQAQFTTTQAPTGQLRNLDQLKPPPGARVAIVVFEDLGCPHCAAAHPLELQVAAKTHVPLLRYDAPITSHIWTFQAAVNARYIQHKLSPQLAAAFRTDVFAAQMSISSKDDLQRFTQIWLQHHGKPMPLPIDPDGSFARQVTADKDLAHRLNLGWTPTIIVITNTKQQVVSGAGPSADAIPDLLHIVQTALAQTASAPSAAHHTPQTH